MNTKKCTCCEKNRPLKDYPRDKSISSGCKAKCKECYSLVDSVRYLKKSELIKSQARSWYASNKQKAAASKRNRLKNDINAHLADVLRSRLNKAIKRSTKAGSAVDDLGCSIDQLKAHLESKFEVGMTWENYGPKGWHIDHIIPLSSFNLTNLEELKKACHYTNLQPMWAEDNWSKGAKWL